MMVAFSRQAAHHRGIRLVVKRGYVPETWQSLMRAMVLTHTVCCRMCITAVSICLESVPWSVAKRHLAYAYNWIRYLAAVPFFKCPQDVHHRSWY